MLLSSMYMTVRNWHMLSNLAVGACVDEVYRLEMCGQLLLHSVINFCFFSINIICLTKWYLNVISMNDVDVAFT